MNHTFTIISSQFWSDFWPNFASTVFGLFLGLPLALWTNRVIANAQNRQKQEEEKQRLTNALQIIRQTLAENKTRLQDTITTINDSRVQFDTQLDISVWDAVKGDISYHLHDPNLKKKIAYHFSYLMTMAKLNDMYLEFSTGMESVLNSAKGKSALLKTHLLSTATFLLADIEEILQLIDHKLTNK